MTNFNHEYKFPFEENPNAPAPSRANYDENNIAWVIEMFAGILGENKNNLVMKYENNSPDNIHNNIYVQHPDKNQGNSKSYYDDAVKNGHKISPEMERYNMFAKKSQRLLDYMEESPANIEYFQNSNGSEIS